MLMRPPTEDVDPQSASFLGSQQPKQGKRKRPSGSTDVASATSTWPAEFRENIWAKNLLDTPLCRTNFTSDAHMRSAISEWF